MMGSKNPHWADEASNIIIRGQGTDLGAGLGLSARQMKLATVLFRVKRQDYLEVRERTGLRPVSWWLPWTSQGDLRWCALNP